VSAERYRDTYMPFSLVERGNRVQNGENGEWLSRGLERLWGKWHLEKHLSAHKQLFKLFFQPLRNTKI
jgi:hypothetical protein